MTGETDELVAGAQGGDEEAYEAVFERVAPRLLLYVRLRLGPALEARVEPMDVLQETYLQAHKSFAQFQPSGSGSFAGWLFGIADNRLRDLAEHFGAEKRRALREARRGSAVLQRLEAQAAGPGTECAQREAQRRLLEAVNDLAEGEREAVLLRFFHQLTFAEIAARLGISEAGARRSVVRASARLGRHLRSLQE